MIKKYFFLLSTFLIILMVFSACNLPSDNSEESELVQTLTYTAMELATAQAQLAEAEIPTATSEASETPEMQAPETENTPEPTTTSEPTATVTHLMVPGNPPAGRESGVTDSNSSATASEGRANAGEDFSHNLYERPFTSQTMTYRPDLDIIKTTLNRDSSWIYIEIEVFGENEAGGLLGTYGAEFDLDLDGRGDVLILASNLKNTWSTENVFAWKDSDNDVGGGNPILADSQKNTNGYDQAVFEQGAGADPDLVWARVNPNNSKAAQIAFKYDLLNRDGEYLWWAVTEGLVKNQAWYDYNDHFTHDQAGSPLVSLSQYPLKELAEIDNTCRWSVGFTPDGTEPGICYIAPTPTPTATATQTPTVTVTPVQYGAVAGKVWVENNGNSSYDGSPDTPAEGRTVTIYQGSCSGANRTTTTNVSGDYGFSSLAAGQYCVVVETMGCNYQTPAQTINVPAGGTAYANFYCVPVP